MKPKYLRHLALVLVVGALLLPMPSVSSADTWRQVAADQEFLFNGWVLRRHRYTWNGYTFDPFTFGTKEHWEYHAAGALGYLACWLRSGNPTGREITLWHWERAMSGFSKWQTDGGLNYPTPYAEFFVVPYLMTGWFIRNYFPADMPDGQWLTFKAHSQYLADRAYNGAGYQTPWSVDPETEQSTSEDNALWAAIYRWVALINGYGPGNDYYEAAYLFAGHAYTRSRTWEGATTSTVRVVVDIPSVFNIISNRHYQGRLSATPNYNFGTALYLGYYQIASRYDSDGNDGDYNEYAPLDHWLYWQTFYDQLVNSHEVDEVAGRFYRDGGWGDDRLDLDALQTPSSGYAPFYFTDSENPNDPYCVDEWAGSPIHGSAAYASMLTIIDKCNGSYESEIRDAYQTLLNSTEARGEGTLKRQRYYLQTWNEDVLAEQYGAAAYKYAARYLLWDGANHTIAMILLEYL